MRFPSHLSPALASTVKPGDAVTVAGFLVSATRQGQTVKALTMTNAATGQTVVDQPPASRPLPPELRGLTLTPLTVRGTVARLVVNDHGDVDGLILSSGEQVKFRPPNGATVVMLLGQQPGAPGAGAGVEDQTMTSEAGPHRRSLWALDWLNVFVADVKTGVGPYLAIYLQSGLGELLANRNIAIFALAAVLFHFANAAMLPLLGQRLSVGHDHGSSLYMSACIIVAQLVMIPVAAWAGRLAGTHGRKPVFMLGFSVLPVRGVLYTLSGNPYVLVSIQLLDAIGAGIFGVLSVLVVADLTRGTGRFNIMNGAINTATGIGAALSNAVSGVIVQYAGYNGAFLTLAGIAAVAALWFGLAMPETQGDSVTVQQRTVAEMCACQRVAEYGTP